MANRNPTLMEQTRTGKAAGSTASGGFKLKQGIRNFLLFVLGWSIFANLLMITGMWEFKNDTMDTVFITMSVLLPAMGILFILILDDA